MNLNTYRQKGITLLELLIALSISAFVLTLITFFAIDITDFGLFLGDRLEVERDLERTLREFIVEVRSMGNAENGGYPIAAAGANTFTFYTDVDADGTFEQVRYFLNGTTLQRGITEPSGTPTTTYEPDDEVVRDVIPFVVPGPALFTYWEQGWIGETASLSEPITLSEIRMVRLRVTVDRDPNQLPAGSTQFIQATIRNLRGEI